MPIYEYEPVNWDCAICNNRCQVLQGINEPALTICPTCGLEVRKLVSLAQINKDRKLDYESSAKKGFTTYKKLEKGRYEKIAGEGPSEIASPNGGSSNETSSKPKKQPKRINLDG